MSDPQEMAKSARLALAEALQALQTASDVPDALVSIAEPIAKSMGLLHAIERSGGQQLGGAEQALANVRAALDSLQTVGVSHPAVDQATEAVAGSLSKLFALARAKAKGAEAPAAAPAAAFAPAQPAAAPAPQPGPFPAAQPAAQPAVQPAAQPAVRPALTPAAPPAMTPMPAQPAWPQAPVASPAATAMAGTPAAMAGVAQPAAGLTPEQTQAAAAAEAAARQLAEAEARAAEARRIAEQKAAEAAARAQEAQRRAAAEAVREASVAKRVPGQTDAPAPPDGAARINVELGAHSASNFYKGLSGNDVVDHGGIFVATYQISKVGRAVALRVLLPGELEFEADAVVQWVRETRTGEGQPGFGAKFTRISGAGRQLVYRYARNREPMFYDDF